MRSNQILKLTAYFSNRMKRSHWILGDQGNLFSSNLPKFFRINIKEIFPIKTYASACNLTFTGKDPEDSVDQRAFSASRFSDNSQNATGINPRGDTLKDMGVSVLHI